jgi:anti-sigma factor RsiW
MAYAEALVDSNGTVSARVGAHVKECPQCMAEVKSMHRTLRVVGAAPELEPPAHLTAAILLAAREERGKRDHRVPRAALAFGKAVGFAAGLFLVASVVFSAALESPGDGLQPAKVEAENLVDVATAEPVEKDADDMQRMTAQV